MTQGIEPQRHECIETKEPKATHPRSGTQITQASPDTQARVPLLSIFIDRGWVVGTTPMTAWGWGLPTEFLLSRESGLQLLLQSSLALQEPTPGWERGLYSVFMKHRNRVWIPDRE